MDNSDVQELSEEKAEMIKRTGEGTTFLVVCLACLVAYICVGIFLRHNEQATCEASGGKLTRYDGCIHEAKN